MPVVVVATVKPLPDHREAVLAAITEAIGSVHAEPGCELYALNQGADRLVMVEQWSSLEALQTHSRGAALQKLGPALEGKLSAALEVLTFEPVPAGDPGKGTLR
jgi:quinol monooxygenase YgiN